MCYPSWRGVASLVGGLSLNIALGMVYSMSNASIYVASYMRWVRGSGQGSVSLADVSWVYTLNVVFLGIMLPVGGYINKRIGVRQSLYAASVLFTVSTFASYWLVSSYVWFLVVFGCVIGVADGIAFNLPQYCAYRHWPNNMGLASSVVISGLALSPILFSPLQTKVVNPGNLMPDLSDGNALYFSQEEVLVRVPWMFVAMGLLVTLLCLISALTMFEPEDSCSSGGTATESVSESGVETEIKSGTGSIGIGIAPSSGSHPDLNQNSDPDPRPIVSVADVVSADGEDLETAALCEGRKLILPEREIVVGRFEELYLLRRLAGEKRFWLIFWLIFFFSQYVHFVASWWKNIGIIHVKISDEALATFGTLITSGSNVIGRCFLGSCIDRYGGRRCFIAVSFSCMLSVVLLQISLLVGSQALYLACIGLVFLNVGAGFVLFPPIVAIYFGVDYFTLIYGIVYIGRSLGVLANSLLTWLLMSSIRIDHICMAIGLFTFVFFALSTKFYDKIEFSDLGLEKKLFPSLN